MIPQISTWARGPMAATAHEARRNPRKSPDRVHICRDCNKTRNMPYLSGSSPDHISSSPQFIRGNESYSVIQQKLDVGILLLKRA
jgi:hypothetical protein